MKKSAYLPAALVGIAAVAGLGTASASDWKVDTENSMVSFDGVQQGSKFTGRFEDFDAMIDLDPKMVEHGSIVGTVKTESVNTRDHDRDAQLLDADWFDTKNYPEARFESESITKQADGSYVADGKLTLKGMTKPAKMTFSFDASGSTAKFSGAMKVDRFDFNVGEGWNDTSWVGQDVDVHIELDLSH